MRQFIDGVEVIADREPPVRRTAHRDVTDAPPLPARFTPSAPTRRDEPYGTMPPTIAPPMLLESEPLDRPERSESPEPLEPRPIREHAPDDEADEDWFDGTLQSDDPRPAPDTGGNRWHWLAGAAAGLVSTLAALSAWWLATR
jgi:hypothetical protein